MSVCRTRSAASASVHAAKRAGQRAGSRGRQSAARGRCASVRDRLRLPAAGGREAARRAAPPGAGADRPAAARVLGRRRRQPAASRSTSSISRAWSRRWRRFALAGRDLSAVAGRRICIPARRPSCWCRASRSASSASCTRRWPRLTAWAGRPVLVGEFDLEAILAAVPERYTYTPVPRFPAALRDIAVIVDEAMPAERVVAEIRPAAATCCAACGCSTCTAATASRRAPRAWRMR